MLEQTVTFKDIVEKNFSTLDLYTTAITRAHGKNHPEVFEVREVFEAMNLKIKTEGVRKPNLEAEFAQLRGITNNYHIPEDVCETFEGVYNMLAEADKVYHS